MKAVIVVPILVKQIFIAEFKTFSFTSTSSAIYSNLIINNKCSK